MKKYLSRLLALAVIAPALVSCMEQLQDIRSQSQKHTVYFSTANPTTKTGLSIAEGIVTPDWRVTDHEDVHFFEMDDTENAYMAAASSVVPYDNDLGAHFVADFETEMTIIVTPPSPTLPADGPSLSATSSPKALSEGEKTYGAVVAKMKEVDNAPVFYIPSTQKPNRDPDAETLKDPEAEFLVGFSRDSYASPTTTAGDEEKIFVDLYFDRVASLSRLGFSEFLGTGEKVMSVKIYSETSMTGSVKPVDITFANTNTVSFTPDEGAGVLTLDYGDGAPVAAGTPFYAYFVSMPGSFKITSIEILTDQYRYTKAFDGGKSLSFDLNSLTNLSMDLSTAVAEEISSNVWYKASVLEAGYDYIIVSNGQALKNNSHAKVVAAQAIEIVDNTISPDPTEGIIWRAASVPDSDPDGNGFVLADYGTHTLSNGSEHLWRHSNSGTFTLEASNADITKYMIWSYDGTYLTNHSIYMNNGSATHSDYYAYYSGGWSISTTKNTAMLFTNRAPQNISFSADNAKYDIYEGNWIVDVPTLSNAQTTVTYALSDDSDPDVATVDPTTGEVTVGSKIGSVTIVATAAGSNAFQAGSASYTLTVVNNDPNVKVYRKVTATTDLEVGAEYLLVFEGLAGDTDGDGDPKVFNPVLNTDGTQFAKAQSSALDVTISSGTISSNQYVDCHFTLEGRYYLKANKAGKYIYPGASGSSSVMLAEATASNALTITFDNGIAEIKNGTRYLVWSISSTGHYFSCNTAVSGTYSTGICLYKLEDTRPEWTMSYSPNAAEYDLYTKAWSPSAPSLSSNATTTVTYSSSDETVAMISASGVVAPIKTGTATITATAAADATHKKTTASYVLTVKDTSPAKEYVRVESDADLEVGAKYLIVYESGSMVFKPILPSDATHYTSGTDNAISVTILNKTISSNNLGACELLLEDGYHFYVESVGKYLYPTYNNIDAENPKTTSHAFDISISDGTATVHRTSNNSDYKLRYTTGRKYFQSSTSSANVALYKLDDGRQAQSISFNSSSAEYDLGTTSWTVAKPTLDVSGAHTTVTYESSDPTVATVTNTGEVTPLKKGKTTITAKAAGNTTYKPAEASYELTVKNSAQTAVYYTKVNSRDGLPGASQTSATGNYIFVYEDGNKAYVFKAICDGTPTGSGSSSSGHVELTKAGSAIEVTLTDDGIEATDAVMDCQIQIAHHKTDDGKYNLKPARLGTYWIRLNNDRTNGVRILAMTSEGYSSTFTFDGTGNNLEIKRTDSSRNAYLNYNATNNCFEATSTASKISVYQLSE